MLSKTKMKSVIPSLTLNKNVKSLFVVCDYLPDDLSDVLDDLEKVDPAPSEKESIKNFLSEVGSDEQTFYIIEYKVVSIKKANKTSNYTITQTTKL